MSGIVLLAVFTIVKNNTKITVGTQVAPSLEPLTHRQNAASLSLFYKYYLSRYSFELA